MVAMVFFCIVTPVTHTKFGAQAHICGFFQQFFFSSRPPLREWYGPLPPAARRCCTLRYPNRQRPEGGKAASLHTGCKAIYVFMKKMLLHGMDIIKENQTRLRKLCQTVAKL